MNSLRKKMESANINELLECINKMNVAEQFVNTFIPGNQNIPGIQQRKNSQVYSMRKFHNAIKAELIKRVSEYYSQSNNNKNTSLLDIAVGRGGDLMKWEAAGITKVVGFDKSQDSIYSTYVTNPGAISRYKNSKVKVKVNYSVGDATDINLKVSKNAFDFVSCQFALQYFFKSEQNLRNVLSLVSKSLKVGGYFYGTTLDGNKIKALLKGKTEVTEKLFYIIKKKFCSISVSFEFHKFQLCNLKAMGK